MAANRTSPSFNFSSYGFLSSRFIRRLFRGRVRRRVLSLVVILSLLSLPISLLPVAQLPVMAASVVTLNDSPLRNFVSFIASFFSASHSPRRADTMEDRINRVSYIEVSPRRFVGYQGQTIIFGALPSDSSGRTIQGVRFTWQSLNSDKVQIDEQGRATFLQPGLARILCRAGTIQASVPVLVRPGQRPRQTDAQWRADQDLIDEAGNIVGQIGETSSITKLASALLDKLSPTAYAQTGPPGYDDFFYDEFYTEPRNLVGSPRNRAVEVARMGTVMPEGSNFTFAVPIISLEGRGVSVDLTLYYDSRVWFRRGSAITFNPVYSWPAPGCSLGFGRVITYGSTSALKYVFIDRDGTRRYLGQGGTASQAVTLQTSDGTHITYVGNATTGGTLFYNNGAQVTISSINNRLLASAIQDPNGNYITITYKGMNYPPMAIDYITDTLGRVIQFHYGADGLTHIAAPGFGGTSQNPVTSVLTQFSYQSQSVSNSFSGLTVENVPTGTVNLLRDIRVVATNNQYRLSYSAYGMAYSYSLRRQASYIGQDGLERAATSFNYPTSASSLTDAPAFSQRTETASSSPTSVYSYATTADAGAQTMTFTITRPDSSQLLLTRSTNSASPAFGLLVQNEVKSNMGASMARSVSAYANDPGGSPQVQSVIGYDDIGTPTKVDFDYDQYGNIANKREYGFQEGGVWKVRRRAGFVYKTDTAYVNAYLRGLVTVQYTYDAKLNTNDGDDEPIAKSTYTYDDYAAMGGMDNYGGTASPPGHKPSYDTTYTLRGNVTGTTQWHDLVINLSITKRKKYDIFGNVVKEQLACCNEQTATTSQDSYWSLTNSITKGISGGPQLIFGAEYDFNTSAVKTGTDPNNLQKTYGYDGAMRFSGTTAPTGATSYTAYNDDNLTSTTTTTYNDAGVQKTIITTKTYDGWGRVIQEVGANNGQVNTSYDAMARVASRTNPFTVGGQPGPVTTYTYDPLGRTKDMTLPDGQKLTNSYNGNSVTVTDQVNRKIQRQTDGLGRLVTVNEQDSTGSLTQGTSYTYDLLNNLTQVDQGGQLRSFKYDALSRMVYERIPEQKETINDGTGTKWTAKFTYTDFSAVATRQDARGVITTYGYDSLNRLTQVSYNTVSGIATAPTVIYTYDTDPVYGNTANGKIVRINVGSDFEERYGFDSFKRVTSTTRKLGSGFYTSSYQYNDVSQMTRLTYPSNRAITIGHDSRARVTGLSDVATGTNYISNVGYNEAGQPTGLTLGNGVVEVYGYDVNRMQMTSRKAGTVAPYTNRLDLVYNHQAAAGEMGAGSKAGNVGQMMSITGTINSTTESASYTYDLLGRLSTSNQTTNGASAQRRFAYDRWGNRTAVWDATSGGSQIQSIVIDQTLGIVNNRIKVANGQSYSYDESGNVINDGAHSYTYDSENRLVSVDGGATEYSYDYQNCRWKKVTAGTITLYFWEGSQVIAEHNGSTGAVVVDYVYSGDRMIAKVESGATQYFLTDRLSTRVIMDASGNVMGRQGHLPFGEELGASGTSEKHRFTSYDRDSSSGLDYAVNRYSNSALGRFYSSDPYRTSRALKIPQSWNRYTYVNNDPINSIDPRGLDMLAVDCSGNIGSTYYEGDIPITPFSVECGLSSFPTGFNVGLGGGQAPPLLVALQGKAGKALSNAWTSLVEKIRLNQLSADCYNNVVSKIPSNLRTGEPFDLHSFFLFLSQGADFYDGTQSHAPVAGTLVSQQQFTAGQVRNPPVYGGNTVAEHFNNRLGVNAVTSIIATSLTIFVRPGNDANGNPVVDLSNGGDNARNLGFLFHEGLHGFLGRVDEDLQTAFELPKGGPSSNISEHIRKHCFE
jgi:RHS repeat-associated protein